MNLTDAVDFEYPENEMVKPLKNVTLSEADSTETFKFKPFEYERGVATKTAKGVINTIRDMQDLPEQVKIFGKRMSFGFGGYFGDTPEETERKKLNLITAERNLNEEQAERYKYTSGREAESLSYGVGGGIVNYGTMLVGAGAVGTGLKVAGAGAKAISTGAEIAGLGTMSAMELAGQVQDKTPQKEGEIDVEEMTPEWARKATGGTLAYTAVSAVTEKYVGFGRQMKMWEKPIEWGNDLTSKALTTIRTAGKNALSEGATEGIQDLEAAGIGLLDGTVNISELPARLQQAWKSAIIGGIIGGGVGTAAAMKSARNVKKQLRDMVAPVVGEADAQSVAEAIYDAGTDDMSKAISIELELSSELKNKHGKVWNSMLSAVDKAMQDSGAFQNMTEDERASYANTAAKHYADQALAEAHLRGTTLDAIIRDIDITYDNGIKIARNINLFDALKNPEMIPPKTKLKRTSLNQFIRSKGGIKDVGGDLKSRDAVKEYPGLINKNGMSLDDMAMMAWENGYFPEFSERPTVNDLLDAIDEGLQGNNRYNTEEARDFNDAIADLQEELDRLGIDWKNMTAAEIEQAVNEIPELKSMEREAAFYENFEPDIEREITGMTEDERDAYDERMGMQLYQEGDDRDLYATHNMSLAGVRDALKLGGLAMPSLAMRKVSQGNINQFGDIVFVANERLATPSKTNEVYDRDAWTPNLSYAIKYDLTPEANTFVRKVLEKVGREREASTFIYNIVDSVYSPSSNTMAMDLYEIDKGLEDSKFRGNEQDYLDWYDEHFTANTEPYLWTENASNTDMVRKKFTLDNMMKILRKQERSGGGFIGDYIFDVYKLLNFRSQKFKNLKEIKKNRHKLVSREEAQKGLDKLNEDFLALAEELKKEGEDYSFGDATYGLGLALIQDSDEKIVYWLKDKNLQSDDAAVKKVKDFIERMKNIPTDYFEVKPRRKVDFSEFSGVIIPEGAQYDEVARILEKQHYLNVERVEKGNEEQYENALQNIQANASTTFFQSAFAGSRVDYDRPSLEAIGSGEGNQAHGWGLYYALDRDVAEGYREAFLSQSPANIKDAFGVFTVNGKPFLKEYKVEPTEKLLGLLRYSNEIGNHGPLLRYLENKIEQWKSFKERGGDDKGLTERYQKLYDDVYNKGGELLTQGQVHEVDIPENPYLLDEQKTFAEQSDFVKEAIRKLNNEDVNDILDDDTTGEDIYGELVNYFSKQVEGNDLKSKTDNAQKLASQALEKVGIKGITYDGKQDGRCFVIFNPADVKVIQKFYQRGKTAKGFTQITPDAYIIKLLESADESTLPHELAHYWLTEMWNYTRTGRASESYMKRWQVIADYLGIKPEQTRLTRAQQEKFASSYEAYLTRGQLPTPLIGSVFDDYDKWLQRVYNDYNKINYQSGMGKRRVRLTDAAVKFFQSMTTGTLEAPVLAPKDTGVKLETEPQLPATTSNELIEEPAVSDTTIVTRGDKGVSKVYKRGALLHPEAVSQPGLSYDKIHLDEQALAAKEFVEKDLNKAREFIGGEKDETGKLTRTAVMQAYENEMLRIGNLDEYDRVRKIHSYEQTRRGQEIAAERIETDDVTNPTYWLEKAEHNLANQVAQKLFKGKERTKQLTETIKKETESLQKAITGKTVAEQQQIMRQTAERLKKEYGLDTLYQMPDDINDMTTQEFIKEVFGINLDGETRNDIINKSEQVRKLWENTIAKGGNPSVEAMKAKRELNDLINSKTPSNVLAIWTSIFGRGVMLTSVKSPVLNIISNIEAGFTEGITRRLMYGTTEKAVDKSVKEEFSKYAWEVYKASADIVTTMNDYDDDMRIIGEQILHSQGQGRFRAASRKVEEISFKYLMGAPDAVAKTFAFNDTADLLATKIAREEGAKDISKRATEIYKDAILIKPQTEQGQKVREQAQEQAHYTTFTNDSWAAKFGLKAREFLNTVGQGKIRLGDLAMKFVKTPANVQMMGLEYGFGLLYTAYNVQEIIRNPQSETSKIAIKAAVRNGLGIALAALLYSMLDPDDYFSEFDTLNPKEKDRMRARGAMPNSIKVDIPFVGEKWVSLDYFGQLGIPLVGMLEARRNNGLRSYVQSGLTQAAKIPGIKETKQLIDSMSEYARYDLKPEKIAQMMAGTVLDQARAMTIPAIVNDIAKMTDDYERDTMGGVMDKVISSIPGLRQTLPERYGIQGLVKTEPALSTLLFGSRVKTEQSDKLVREVEKLAGKSEQPSISDVTKYGDLRLLSPEKKVKVRKEFYKLYNSESKKLIATREYQKKSADDKKKALNKVRSRVVKSLKEKYSNDIQREKRRR